MKYVCIILLSACILAGGSRFATKYKQRIFISERFLSFLCFAENEVAFSNAPVFEIVQKFERINTEPLSLFSGCSEPVAASIRFNLQREKNMDEKHKRMILEFFEAFGTADEGGSIRLIRNYYSAFEKEVEQIKNECNQSLKLIRRLSVLAAVGAAIILI